MEKHKKLTKTERLELAILKNKGYSIRAIARAMRRAPSTISRELRRNAQQQTVLYHPQKAHHKAYVRKKYARFQWKKINEDPVLKRFIMEKLKEHWNPDAIAGYLKQSDLPFYTSKTAIYAWLYSARGQEYCKYLYTRRYRRKKHRVKTLRTLIPNRVGIQQRFLSATNRSRYGHLEADTIVSGKRGSGALLVVIDRKSRHINIRKLRTLRPKETLCALQTSTLVQTAKSITFDNGIENRHHEQLGMPTFFCDPYSSWQKGSVENVNKMIRRYIPKGTSIAQVPEEYIQAIEDIINKKPRKVLGYKSSCDIMMKRRLFRGGVAIEG